MSLSIVVPTIGGRESILRTLDSIASQVNDGDEIIVVSEERDGLLHSYVQRYEDQYGGEWVYGYPEDGPCENGCFGHHLRNVALDTTVTGSHFWSIDDDDIMLPGAMELLRACQADVPVIFRARWGNGHPAAGVELPIMQEVRYGNIATPMILAPVGEARWGLDYGGDFTYAEAVVAEFGEPIWRDEFVALVRPVAA